MFWTALCWGLGLGIGACASLLALIVLVSLLDKVTGKSKERQDALALNRESLGALKQRNEMTEQTNCHLDRLADHLGNIAELNLHPNNARRETGRDEP